mmetsp:Transcript_97589/g.178362  ORF Transcript_97589/g.178362 Transcript_97589/m.178362 type:complete len:277 (-) Transcript_97589:174-1004(-)
MTLSRSGSCRLGACCRSVRGLMCVAEPEEKTSGETVTPRGIPVALPLNVSTTLPTVKALGNSIPLEEDAGDADEYDLPADAPIFQGKPLNGEASKDSGGGAEETSQKEEMNPNAKLDVYLSVSNLFNFSSSTQTTTVEEVTRQATSSADQAKPTEASKVEEQPVPVDEMSESSGFVSKPQAASDISHAAKADQGEAVDEAESSKVEAAREAESSHIERATPASEEAEGYFPSSLVPDLHSWGLGWSQWFGDNGDKDVHQHETSTGTADKDISEAKT